MPAYADQLGLTGLVDPNTTFEDNFDGSALDRTKWQVREGPRWRRTVNGPISEMTWTTQDAVRVRNGALEMVAHNDPVTGRIETGWIQSGDDFMAKRPMGIDLPKLADGYSGNFEQAFGYWEARMKFSALPGAWAAFWVHSYKMTEIFNKVERTNRPDVYGTEYDVVEHAHTRNTHTPALSNISQTVNYNGYASYYRAQAAHPTPANYGPSFSGPDQYHVYGLLWTDKSVKFTLDGHVTFTLTDPVMISKIAQTVILSNEAGAPGALEPDKGSNYWGHIPAGGYGSLESSQARMTVDYVRVWRIPGLNPSQPPSTGAASIDGIFYEDKNLNAMLDVGEPRLAGRTVWIDLDNDSVLDSNEPTRVSAADGSYEFTDLPAGIYTVRQVLDASSKQTAPKTVADGTISMSGAVRASVDFGLTGTIDPNPTPPPPPPPSSTTAVVTGLVFADANNSGRQDTGEVGQGGVAVYLDYNMNGLRESTEPSVVTVASGTFRFEGARITSMAVRLLLGGSSFVQTAPVDGTGARWLTTSPGVTHTVYSFGVRARDGTTPTPTPTPTNPSLAIVTGGVFNDRNRNGRQDSDETGPPNLGVFLDYNANNRRDTDEPMTTTSSAGTWRFESVRITNALAIRIALGGTGFTQTLPIHNQSIWIATNAGRTHSAGSFAVVGSATTPPPDTTPPPPGPTPDPSLAIVTGGVFNDLNRNGRHDSDEAGPANLMVFLDYNANNRRDADEAMAITSSAGVWRFDNVRITNALAIRIALGGTGFTQTLPIHNQSIWIATNAGRTHNAGSFGIVGA
jgi:beta-glucanase (GH16 family)